LAGRRETSSCSPSIKVAAGSQSVIVNGGGESD